MTDTSKLREIMAAGAFIIMEDDACIDIDGAVYAKAAKISMSLMRKLVPDLLDAESQWKLLCLQPEYTEQESREVRLEVTTALAAIEAELEKLA